MNILFDELNVSRLIDMIEIYRNSFIMFDSLQVETNDEFMKQYKNIVFFTFPTNFIDNYKSDTLKPFKLYYTDTGFKFSTVSNDNSYYMDMKNIQGNELIDKLKLFRWEINEELLANFLLTHYFNNNSDKFDGFITYMSDILEKYRLFYYTSFVSKLNILEIPNFQPIFGLFLNELFKQLINYQCQSQSMKYCDANYGLNVSLIRYIDIKNTETKMRNVILYGYTNIMIHKDNYENEIATNCHSILKLKLPFDSLFCNNNNNESFAESKQLYTQITTLNLMKQNEKNGRNITIGGLTDFYSIKLCFQERNTNKVYMSNDIIDSKLYIMYLMLLCLNITDELFDIIKPIIDVIYDTDETKQNNNNTNNSQNKRIQKKTLKNKRKIQKKQINKKKVIMKMNEFDENFYFIDSMNEYHLNRIEHLNEIMNRRKSFFRALTFESLNLFENNNSNHSDYRNVSIMTD